MYWRRLGTAGRGGTSLRHLKKNTEASLKNGRYLGSCQGITEKEIAKMCCSRGKLHPDLRAAVVLAQALQKPPKEEEDQTEVVKREGP